MRRCGRILATCASSSSSATNLIARAVSSSCGKIVSTKLMRRCGRILATCTPSSSSATNLIARAVFSFCDKTVSTRLMRRCGRILATFTSSSFSFSTNLIDRVASSFNLFLKATLGRKIEINTAKDMITINKARTRKCAAGFISVRYNTGNPRRAASVMKNMDIVMFELSLNSVCKLRAW